MARRWRRDIFTKNEDCKVKAQKSKAADKPADGEEKKDEKVAK